MKPINNWDNVKSFGERPQLPAGAYVCEIKGVKEVPNRATAGTHLEIKFDIVEGEYRDFFAQDWRSQTREDKFWGGVISQNIPLEGNPKYEAQCSFFKRFVEAIEDSNPGYHWAWDERTLVGKRCGVVFGLRERISSKGTLYTVASADSIISLEDLRAGRFTIPDVRRAGGSAAPVAAVPGGPANAAPAAAARPSDDWPF